MKYKIVSTFGPGGWELYARRMVESMRAFWPDAELVMYYHDLEEPAPNFEGVTFKSLNSIPAFQALKRDLGGGSDQFSLKYCFKAFALADAVTPCLDWIGFFDADVQAMRPVDDNLIGELFNNSYDLTYLYRDSVRGSEGSFVGFNLQTPAGASFLADWYGLYASREFLHYKEQFDNAVLDRLVAIHQAHSLRVKNLAPRSLGLDAFHQSILGAYFVHYKGGHGSKQTIADPGLAAPSRYTTLCEILAQTIPIVGRADIIEVGTWNGSRAVQMAEAAFATGLKTVTYQGFDTFDEGNDRQHEGHTKPHASHNFVRQRLECYREYARQKGLTFNFCLTMGNSLDTLHSTPAIEGSFAYIDGGHSLETVASDYEALKHIPYIVFDDLLVEPEDNAPVGPREVVRAITGKQKRILQTPDRYAGCTQTISFGLVVAEGMPVPSIQSQIKVKPIDSVDKSEQFQHIAENSAAFPTWLEPYQAHEGIALMVSAGPTLPDHLEEIRTLQQSGATIFAVKHALPVLKAAGINPDFTVILDPRPIEGLSTHGVIRTHLFSDVAPADCFLIASMTHPTVRRALEEKGARLFGWHAHTSGTQEANLPEFEKGLVIGGGTCSATRMPMIAFVMGFRRLRFYGYDFFYPAATPQELVKQPFMNIKIGGCDREFKTTGELIAAMQDLGTWNKWMIENRMAVHFVGTGAGAVVWETTAPDYIPPKEFKDRP